MSFENEFAAKVLAGEMSIQQAITKAVKEYGLPRPESKVQIVIAPRGWVFVGYAEKFEHDLVITRANVIRRWGTTKGIGELVNGPKKDTILDPAGMVRVPLSAVLARIDCEEGTWNAKI